MAHYRRLSDPDPWLLGHLMNNLGVVSTDTGHYETARAYFAETLALRQTVSSPLGGASVQLNLGIVWLA